MASAVYAPQGLGAVDVLHSPYGDATMTTKSVLGMPVLVLLLLAMDWFSAAAYAQ